MTEKKTNIRPAVVLDRNFRSVKGVTDAVNFVFRQLMSRETGDLEYEGSEELVASAAYPETDEPAVELELLDLAASEEEEEMAMQESRRLAVLLREQRERLRVWEGERERPLRWSDCCILLRKCQPLCGGIRA